MPLKIHVLGLFAFLALAGCGPQPEGPGEAQSGNAAPASSAASQAQSSTEHPRDNLFGCSAIPYGPNIYQRAASGAIDCGGFVSNLGIEVCLQQLVTGGWQQMDWTCRTVRNGSTTYLNEWTAAVPYWTSGRWYRMWMWYSINGQTGTVYSASYQGGT